MKPHVLRKRTQTMAAGLALTFGLSMCTRRFISVMMRMRSSGVAPSVCESLMRLSRMVGSRSRALSPPGLVLVGWAAPSRGGELGADGTATDSTSLGGCPVVVMRKPCGGRAKDKRLLALTRKGYTVGRFLASNPVLCKGARRG